MREFGNGTRLPSAPDSPSDGYVFPAALAHLRTGTPLKASPQHEETTVRLITFKELKPMKGISFSREHLRRLEAASKFPKRVRLAEGGDSYGYIEKEIDDYLAARAAARNDGRAA